MSDAVMMNTLLNVQIAMLAQFIAHHDDLSQRRWLKHKDGYCTAKDKAEATSKLCAA
ncbi:hypothetical protein [Vibrio variabilis]|uniref:hypothetical protein n=1 Tax=Vibrio variabilis TaxID=990271 RepID=UPI0013A6C0D0|nr:hypothetical protein [Vibrio variabilis]